MPSPKVCSYPAPGRSRPRPHGLLTLIALLLAALPAVAGAPTGAPAPATTPTTLGEALEAVAAEGMARIRALEIQAKSLDDDQQALTARAGIIEAKADLQRRLLEVQLDFALRDGRTALAAELEGILSRLGRPAVGVTQDRPSPSTAPAGR